MRALYNEVTRASIAQTRWTRESVAELLDYLNFQIAVLIFVEKNRSRGEKLFLPIVSPA